MKKVTEEVTDHIDALDGAVKKVVHEADRYMEPMRKTALQRFPALFILLTSFGVAITFFAFERLIVEFSFLYERPLLMLCIGVGILMGTGTLYKKLG